MLVPLLKLEQQVEAPLTARAALGLSEAVTYKGMLGDDLLLDCFFCGCPHAGAIDEQRNSVGGNNSSAHQQSCGSPRSI